MYKNQIKRQSFDDTGLFGNAPESSMQPEMELPIIRQGPTMEDKINYLSNFSRRGPGVPLERGLFDDAFTFGQPTNTVEQNPITGRTSAFQPPQTMRYQPGRAIPQGLTPGAPPTLAINEAGSGLSLDNILGALIPGMFDPKMGGNIQSGITPSLNLLNRIGSGDMNKGLQRSLKTTSPLMYKGLF